MIMSYVYIWHGLKPESRYSILEKKLDITADGIQLDFGDWNRMLAWSDFRGYKIKPSGLLLIFKSSKYSFFIIPFYAFETKEDLRNMMKLLKYHYASETKK